MSSQGNRMTIREPAVAGMFYPAEAKELQRTVQGLLACAESERGPKPKAMIVPHAGYVYSGPVAAEAYRQLGDERSSIRRVVLLGPAHRVFLTGMAVPSALSFETPLGEVQVDQELKELMAHLPGVTVSDEAHQDEHCLETQLPFLQSILEEFTIAPVVVGECDSEKVAEVIDAVWGGSETLIVISSDLSHYFPYDQAKEIDGRSSRKILEKEPILRADEACGAYAINGLLRSEYCDRLAVELVDLRNSGDTAGTKDRVVGYGAFVFHEVDDA